MATPFLFGWFLVPLFPWKGLFPVFQKSGTYFSGELYHRPVISTDFFVQKKAIRSFPTGIYWIKNKNWQRSIFIHRIEADDPFCRPRFSDGVHLLTEQPPFPCLRNTAPFQLFPDELPHIHWSSGFFPQMSFSASVLPGIFPMQKKLQNLFCANIWCWKEKCNRVGRVFTGRKIRNKDNAPVTAFIFWQWVKSAERLYL